MIANKDGITMMKHILVDADDGGEREERMPKKKENAKREFMIYVSSLVHLS